jgi:hypothetical protein
MAFEMQPKPPQSGVGLTSVILACVSFVSVPLSFKQASTTGQTAQLGSFSGMAIFAITFAAPVIGLVLGVAGLMVRDRRRLLGVLGLALNTLVMTGIFIALMVLSLKD